MQSDPLPVQPVEAGRELAALLDAHLVDLGADEAVAALNRAVAEEASDVGGLDTRPGGQQLARRRDRLRELRAVSVRLHAERAIRAAERDALLAGTPQTVTSTSGPTDRDLRSRSPFAFGLPGGLGLILAYVMYLSLDGIRNTLVVMALAALLAIGLDPSSGG